jgi:hypothetical protein
MPPRIVLKEDALRAAHATLPEGRIITMREVALPLIRVVGKPLSASTIHDAVRNMEALGYLRRDSWGQYEVLPAPVPR